MLESIIHSFPFESISLTSLYYFWRKEKEFFIKTLWYTFYYTQIGAETAIFIIIIAILAWI